MSQIESIYTDSAKRYVIRNYIEQHFPANVLNSKKYHTATHLLGFLMGEKAGEHSEAFKDNLRAIIILMDVYHVDHHDLFKFYYNDELIDNAFEHLKSSAFFDDIMSTAESVYVGSDGKITLPH